MQAYLNRPLFWDFLIAIVVGVALFFLRPYLSEYLDVPSINSIDKIGASLISIGATLIGFLLTIITVIVTFKKGFDDRDSDRLKGEQEKTPSDYSVVPTETVFGKKISKETQFYGTEMHKRVMRVFIGATYEVGVVIFVLLILQFEIIPLDKLFVAIITLQSLILVFLSALRSINIFRLYLNIHVGAK